MVLIIFVLIFEGIYLLKNFFFLTYGLIFIFTNFFTVTIRKVRILKLQLITIVRNTKLYYQIILQIIIQLNHIPIYILERSFILILLHRLYIYIIKSKNFLLENNSNSKKNILKLLDIFLIWIFANFCIICEMIVYRLIIIFQTVLFIHNIFFPTAKTLI